ncbi:MBOAT family O-acyltransferase [Flavicella sediminum]|uniref:MBOAT family O-acyltransferase n=1 Tax=Flavicella sediminum TaxID=2585141 RepID=UPI001FB6FDA9|nr:MBOAT family O-acyltransferase [Flavicella sediminum]
MFYLAPKKLKNIVLLVFSLAFYAWGERKMVVLLVLSSLVDYSSGIFISKGYKKLGLYFSVFFNLGILIYFKYANFIIENLNDLFGVVYSSVVINPLSIVMPLGISFFTFQTMSYTIDVYRGKVKACTNFIDFVTYVSLFPQLVAGPIVRYEEIQHQLKNKVLNVSRFAYGIERFVKGLFKKLFIANNLVVISDLAFESTLGYGTLFNWLGIIAYTLYVYFDVSGYADMAIGLGKMFGFDFPENFNYPYISSSIKEFWRRWHITMSTWFRDYVYISLGGNRKSKQRVLLNLLIVFAVTGLWHGAAWNYVIWGLWHGLFLLIEKGGWLKKMPRVAKHVYVLGVVMIGLVFFRAATMEHAFIYIKQLFVYTPIMDLDILNFSLRMETIVAFALSILFSFPLYDKLKTMIKSQISNVLTLSILRIMVLMVLLFVCYVYIAIGAYNPFIYFKF